MKRLVHFLVFCLLVISPFLISSPVFAADVRQNETLSVSSDSANAQNLKNLYLFGSTVTLTAPVQDDVVTAGGTLSLDSPVSGSILAAGGTINIKNTIGNSVRVAGGTITISGIITNDLVVAGGDVTIDKDAKIGGDVLIAGGTLKIDGPVGGKILFAGGKTFINGTVGKGIQGHAGTLTIGPKAVINGDVTYTSDQQATIDPNAKITGKTNFTQNKQPSREEKNAIMGGGFLYRLLTEIIISILLLYFFGAFILPIFKQIQTAPLKNGALGFGFMVLFPLAAVIMLALFWLGFTAFLLYGIILIFASFVTKIFIGWLLMNWYEKRNKNTYALDWKAGIIGPVVIALVMLIPVLGWLAAALIYLAALGALLTNLLTITKKQKLPSQTKKS